MALLCTLKHPLSDLFLLIHYLNRSHQVHVETITASLGSQHPSPLPPHYIAHCVGDVAGVRARRHWVRGVAYLDKGVIRGIVGEIVTLAQGVRAHRIHRGETVGGLSPLQPAVVLDLRHLATPPHAIDHLAIGHYHGAVSLGEIVFEAALEHSAVKEFELAMPSFQILAKVANVCSKG